MGQLIGELLTSLILFLYLSSCYDAGDIYVPTLGCNQSCNSIVVLQIYCIAPMMYDG